MARATRDPRRQEAAGEAVPLIAVVFLVVAFVADKLFPRRLTEPIR